MFDNVRFSAIFFDFDGTLIDSFGSHAGAYERMFRRFGIDLSREEFLAAYSPDWRATYRAVGLPESEWKEAKVAWLEEALVDPPALLPDASELLWSLRGRCAIGIVSSGTKSRVVADLARTGIADVFDVVITGDDVERPKPDPLGLFMALERVGVGARQSLYVGDADADYQMARAAEVDFIAIDSDFNALGAECPSPRIRSLRELPALVR